MKYHYFVFLEVLLLISLFCSCGTRNRKESEPIKEEAVVQIPVSSREPVIRDSIVSLSFAGYKLGSAPALYKYEVVEQSSVTKDRLSVRRVKKNIILKGITVNVVIDLTTINDTICRIEGTIKQDIFKTLVDTYVAKYDEPTYGRLQESYDNDSWASYYWRYTNQYISLYRRADYEWDLNARPFRQAYFFKYIKVEYEDYALYERYKSLWLEQREYDKRMKPIRDSIEAAKAKAAQDRIREIERKERLKDAYQI